MPSLIHRLGIFSFSLLRGLTKTTTLATPRSLHPEEVFHRLIHHEYARSEQSGHRCRVLLVYQANEQGHVLPLTSNRADKTIALLSRRCRDTDSIGWYRHDHIVGVLLTALRPDAISQGDDPLTARLMDALRGAMPSTDDRSLQMRVIEPGELTALGSLQPVKREA